MLMGIFREREKTESLSFNTHTHTHTHAHTHVCVRTNVGKLIPTEIHSNINGFILTA